MRRYVEKYWATAAGFAVIAAAVAVGVGNVGLNTIDGVVQTSLEQKGQDFADLLATVPGAAETLLTGLSRDVDQETEIRNLAMLGRIDSFSVFAKDGRETFTSKSERYGWLLRDRAGGMTTKNQLAPSVTGMKPPFQIVREAENGRYSVLSPIVRNGSLLGYVSILFDPRMERAGFARTLVNATLEVLGIILVSTGVPLLIYLRRKNKISEAAARIEFLANHDPLTRLANRRRMQEEVDRLIAAARVTRDEFDYCCVDIDGFSEVNDTLGQAQGDELLRVVASRLAAVVGGRHLLGRIAADDFAILFRRGAGQGDVAAFCRTLRAAIAEPVELKGQIVRPQISIGVATLPRDGRTQNELVKHAQLALLRHKATAAGDYVAFEPAMDEETDRRRQIEGLVRSAVENDGFELAYQPLVSGDGKTLLGFEALLRMRNEADGYIPPSVFVPIAEARGYIKRIGTWVIREAARQAALWPDDLIVSINLSAVQFQDGDLVEIVAQALKDARIPGRRIEMEVVESLLLERTDSVISQLGELKALGMTIAMDDFGTGYSSLGYLWKFPFDKLKIDRSFMVAFDEGEANVPVILDTIISLAHTMGMKVTTEGVETREQAELLQTLGCDIQQGYYFGKPMRRDDLASEVLNRFAQRVSGTAGIDLPAAHTAAA